jgi:hypothetical protein
MTADKLRRFFKAESDYRDGGAAARVDGSTSRTVVSTADVDSAASGAQRRRSWRPQPTGAAATLSSSDTAIGRFAADWRASLSCHGTECGPRRRRGGDLPARSNP